MSKHSQTFHYPTDQQFQIFRTKRYGNIPTKTL